jgi:uncharacterized protein YqgV (UPF0045/DUF77 family)
MWISGNWEEMIPLVRQCHERAKKASPRLITIIKIEEEPGRINRWPESLKEKTALPT